MGVSPQMCNSEGGSGAGADTYTSWSVLHPPEPWGNLQMGSRPPPGEQMTHGEMMVKSGLLALDVPGKVCPFVLVSRCRNCSNDPSYASPRSSPYCGGSG